MRKIGILTFHRANNYGAVLQCYALQESLKDIGLDVKVIDYSTAAMIKRYTVTFNYTLFFNGIKKVNLKSVFGGLYIYIRNKINNSSAAKLFNLFRDKYLVLSNVCELGFVPDNMDIYIIGSDQVWNLNLIGDEINKMYFGEFNRDKSSKVYGYAISGNLASIDMIGKTNLQKLSMNFEMLSFREQSMSDKVRSISGVNSRVDIDPTLLLSRTDWNKITHDRWKNERYVLLYEVRKVADSKISPVRLKAEAIAKQLNCKIIEIKPSKFSPTDFVSLFKYAQYVVTSSFHGTAFSIIFERELCCVKLNDGHDSRYIDLLNSLGASSFLVDRDESVSILDTDYKDIRTNLNEIRDNSIKYLKNL